MSAQRTAKLQMSLARQFALAGGVVMLISALLVGWLVQGRIQDVVVRNTANATALYMESFIAPLTQGLADHDDLSEWSRAEIGRLLEQTALGSRVVSFKIWRQGGLLVDASNTALVGQTFDVTENLKLAWKGEVRADFDDTGDQEDVAEHALGLPLLEIYSPIREVGVGPRDRGGRILRGGDPVEIRSVLGAGDGLGGCGGGDGADRGQPVCRGAAGQSHD